MQLSYYWVQHVGNVNSKFPIFRIYQFSANVDAIGHCRDVRGLGKGMVVFSLFDIQI